MTLAEAKAEQASKTFTPCNGCWNEVCPEIGQCVAQSHKECEELFREQSPEPAPVSIMSSAPKAQDFLYAEALVNFVLQNLTIECHTNMASWDRETMQANLKKRAALILTKSLLLDEVERLNHE